MNFFFGSPAPKLDPLEEAKEWKRKLAKEMRRMDRETDDMKRMEKKVLAECKKLVKSNQIKTVREIYGREIIRNRKTIERIMTAKAQMNSVSMALQSSIALMKVQGVMSKSTDIMKAMRGLIGIPEVNATMQEMAREMERAGLVEEMIADAFALSGWKLLIEL